MLLYVVKLWQPQRKERLHFPLVQVRGLRGLDHRRVMEVWEAAVHSATQLGQPVTGALVAQALQLVGCSTRVQLQPASNIWHTPKSIIGLVKQLFSGGNIDLDPCSSAEAQATVQAGKFLTQSEQSLAPSCLWEGSVFINPPYSCQGKCSMQAQFFAKALHEYEAARAIEVLLLLKAAVGCKWFEAVYGHPHAFIRERVAFQSSMQSPNRGQVCYENPHGSVAVYLGPNRDKFCTVFGAIGYIPGYSSWAMS